MAGTAELVGQETDGSETLVAVDSAGGLKTTQEVQYTIVDLSDNSTTVSSVPAALVGVYVLTVLSAHICPIKDNTTTVFNVPASQAVGAWDFGNQGAMIRFETSLIVDPNDAATGEIVVMWKAL